MAIPIYRCIKIGDLFQCIIAVEQEIQLRLLGFQEFHTQEFVVEVHFEPVDKKAQRETHIHDDREHGRLFRQFQSFVETVGTNVLRSLEQVKGNCFWPANEILWNNKGVADSLKQNYHRYPALIPAYTHLHNRAPQEVKKLKAEWTAQGYMLHWQAEQSKTNPELASYFVIYRFENKESVNLDDPSKIVAVTRETNYLLPYDDGKRKYRYVVTAVDRFHNENQGKSKKVKL